MSSETRFSDVKTAYVSSIPADAAEKITGPGSDKKSERREYFVKGKLVGLRYIFPSGELESEYSYCNGVLHGWEYHWDAPGQLASAEQYENGLSHGTFYQWAEDGRLIGTYTMEHGTGIDLWREVLPDGSIGLAEARYYQDGYFHGYEWWFHGGESVPWWETHYVKGERHGIERDWRGEKLTRDSPRYWVHNEKVTKAKYLCAAAKDAMLPPFRLEDNLPYRDFPPEILPHLNRKTSDDLQEK